MVCNAIASALNCFSQLFGVRFIIQRDEAIVHVEEGSAALVIGADGLHAVFGPGAGTTPGRATEAEILISTLFWVVEHNQDGICDKALDAYIAFHNNQSPLIDGTGESMHG